MKLKPPTPAEARKTAKVLHELIARINDGEITLQQAADVGLNLFAQMSIDLNISVIDATTAVVQAREHILRQMPRQDVEQPTTN